MSELIDAECFDLAWKAFSHPLKSGADVRRFAREIECMKLRWENEWGKRLERQRAELKDVAS